MAEMRITEDQADEMLKQANVLFGHGPSKSRIVNYVDENDRLKGYVRPPAKYDNKSREELIEHYLNL